jgi:hypothetical protein
MLLLLLVDLLVDVCCCRLLPSVTTALEAELLPAVRCSSSSSRRRGRGCPCWLCVFMLTCLVTTADFIL